MTKFKIAALFMIWVGSVPMQAQEVASDEKIPLIVSVMNTGTLLPGSAFFSRPLHPGISLGTEFSYHQNEHNRFFQTIKFAGTYHQYVQTTVQLFSEAGYRRDIWRGTAAECRLGIGYLHSFTGTEVFKLEDGVYHKQAPIGRPQFMGSAALGLSYAVSKHRYPLRVFLDYQFYLQMPYVKSYVPLLPNTALHAGASFPFFKLKKR